MIEDALEVATDPDYRFELAIQLGKLEVAKVCTVDRYLPWVELLLEQLFADWSFIFCLQEIATGAHSESKWKQLGELAMSTGMVLLLI